MPLKANGEGDYQHMMDDFKRRPREIAQHLREEHDVEPNGAMRGYEREVWHRQHEGFHYHYEV